MSPATLAVEALLELLEEHELPATRDAGAFRPSPVGILVGLPTSVGGTLSGRTFEVPLYVVSGDPLNTPAAFDHLFGVADAVARAVRTLTYRPSSWRGSSRSDALPAVELTATVTVTANEEDPSDARTDR